MSYKSLLTQTCVILRFIPTKDEYNTPKQNWEMVEIAKCRLTERKSKTKEATGKTDYISKYNLFLLPNSLIQEGDLVEIDKHFYKASRPYKVMGNKKIHHLKVRIREEGEL